MHTHTHVHTHGLAGPKGQMDDGRMVSVRWIRWEAVCCGWVEGDGLDG